MIAPNADQVAEAKALSRKRFGHDRLVGCAVGAPIGLTAAVAAFNLREADAHEHARGERAIDARSALLADRCLWPSPEQLAEIREEWPAVDVALEVEFMLAMGFGSGEPTCVPLSASSAPKGFATPETLVAKIADVTKAAAGSKLWSITSRSSSLSLIVRQPIADVWTAGCVALDAAKKTGGSLAALVGFYTDHLVWCPQPLAVHLDERPGRARDMIAPWTEMGGAGASSSHSFL